MKDGGRGAARLIVVASGLVMVCGVIVLGLLLLDSALGVTTDDSFCLSCHEMAVNIGGEFERNLRLPGSEERHASCSECHLPQELIPRLRRKLRAGRELYHHLAGTLATPELFEARRSAMARAVWRDLQSNRTGECTGCHDDANGAPETQSTIARSYHERAAETGVACVGCHKGVAHELGPLAPVEEGHRGETACLECHAPERVEAIWHVSHSDPAGEGDTPPSEQCADCHLTGSSHMRFPLDRGGLHGGAVAMSDGSERAACIECHLEGPRVDWEVHAHGFTPAVCGSCHQIHPGEDTPRPAAGLDAACTDSCHTWVGEPNETAPTPASTGSTASGERSCVSCHDPHLPPETSRCESCHQMDGPALADQSEEAQRFHERGRREQIDCEECHKGIIHRSPHAELMDATPQTR